MTQLLLGLQVGLKEIWAHKFRSVLTMLGVILGVASLLSMFALTDGMARGMREYLQASGGVERVRIVGKEVPEQQRDLAQISPGRTMADVRALKAGASLVDLVTGEVSIDATITVGSKTTWTRAVGTVPDFMPMGKYEIEWGRMLCDLDLENVNRVAVIGTGVIEALWGERPSWEVLGETILINRRPFQVVGTFPKFESEEQKRKKQLGPDTAAAERAKRRGHEHGSRNRWDPYYWKNNSVIIPVTAVFHEFKSAQMPFGSKEDQGPNYKLDLLSFRVADMNRFEETLEQVRRVLERTHRGIDDFGFDTREDYFDTIEKSIRSIRMSGGLIAGISLIVGGIGIANIMLASITERIREIGVRKAIGATRRDIFVQFVVESGVIGIIGGLLGLIAATGLMRALVWISPAENAPVLELDSVLISFGFAVIIGFLSGLYPAWRASNLDPIEALRYG